MVTFLADFHIKRNIYLPKVKENSCCLGKQIIFNADAAGVGTLVFTVG